MTASLVVLSKRPPDWSHERFSTWWRGEHADRGKRLPGLLSYRHGDVVHDYDDEQVDSFSHHVSQQGTAIVFPSFEYHRVLSLRGGVRYSLVAWVSGPAFR